MAFNIVRLNTLNNFLKASNFEGKILCMKPYPWCFFDVPVSDNWLDQSVWFVLKKVLDWDKFHLFDICWGLKENSFLLLLFRAS